MNRNIPFKRARTLDHLTFDSRGTEPLDAHGNQRGKTFDQAYRVADGNGGFRTVDSTGAFLVGELERLDQTMNMPLASVTFGRDVDLRSDVTVADEGTSFTLSNFASAGMLGGHSIRTGKAWIGKASDQIAGVSVDIAKPTYPLNPWALEIKFTILELESAARLGRPLDAQKLEALQLKWAMDTDEQVYVGDASLGLQGMLNSSLVTNVSNVPNGAAASPLWTAKTPDEILADVNALITSTWQASGWAEIPNVILMPPAQFGYISTTKISNAGNVSILKYVLENNILATSGSGKKLDIRPVKWAIGAGTGGTIGTTGTVDRMMAYSKDKKYIRFPMTTLSRTPIQYDSIYHKSTYFGKLGVTEVVYPETIGYRDGL